MKRAYFDSYLEEHSLPDEWWVSVDNDVLDRLMTLDEVNELEYELPGRVVALLHPDVADADECRWVTYDFEGMANLKAATMIETEPTPQEAEFALRLDAFSEMLAGLKEEMHQIRTEVNEMSALLREVIQIKQMSEELTHRQQFIEAGEEALLAKTIRYEEQLAELDQRREDLSSEQMRSA